MNPILEATSVLFFLQDKWLSYFNLREFFFLVIAKEQLYFPEADKMLKSLEHLFMVGSEVMTREIRMRQREGA